MTSGVIFLIQVTIYILLEKHNKIIIAWFIREIRVILWIKACNGEVLGLIIYFNAPIYKILYEFYSNID